jgi:hypothetical protein
MRCRLVVLTILAVAPLAGQQRDTRGLAADPNVAVRLWVPAGFVEVQGWDRDSIDVRVAPSPGTSLSGGGTRAAAKFSLETSRGDSVLAAGNLRVRVPHGARVSIKSTTASVSVQGVRGELDVMQVSGSITVMDGQGTVRLETIDGTMNLTRVDGGIVVRGGGGAVTLNTVSGTLDLSTVSGRVTLAARAQLTDALRPLQATLETVGGEVQIVGGWHAESRLTVATHSGAVTVFSFGGATPRVETTIPGANVPAAARQASGAAGIITVRSFKGTLNVASGGGI